MSQRKKSESNFLPQATWKFFQAWLRNPLAVAAVSPSSRELAKLMVSNISSETNRVIELGGGTGVFTRAVLDSGIEPGNFLVLELNEPLYQHLREEFAGVHVVCGNALDLKAIAEAEGFLKDGLSDAVISGLGMLSMSKQLQKDILQSVFSVLKPEGRFVQFTYGPVCPINREVMHELGLTAERAGFTLWNVPPASVYTLTRQKSKRVGTVKAERKR